MKVKARTFSGTTSNEVTQREIANRALARKAAAEGFVLLKNEGHFLPAPKGGKIALYGAGAVKTIKGGTGSGDVNERDYVTIAQGMKNAGYEVTTEGWLDSYVKIYDQAREDWKAAILKKAEKMESPNAFFEAYSSTPFFMPCGEKIDVDAAKADGADTAVFVMARIAGENKDRFDKEGDYFISEEERVLLAQVCESYKDVVLVINTGGLMDLAFADTFDNIRSIVQYVQAGQEGGNDMVMPGMEEDHENIRKELKEGTLDIRELKRCIYNTVNIILQSNQYEEAVSYENQFDGLGEWMTVK